MIFQAIDYIRYRIAFWLWCRVPYRWIDRRLERIWKDYERRNP
jgi:hypothetical protein